MARLSFPNSSRLILAGSYAGAAGVSVYLLMVLLFGVKIDLDEEAVNETLHGAFDYLELARLSLQALGPVFGMIVASTPFFPFTFIYASWVCPSRITITSTEIRAKFFGTEKTWQTSELESVKFQNAGDQEFIIGSKKSPARPSKPKSNTAAGAASETFCLRKSPLQFTELSRSFR